MSRSRVYRRRALPTATEGDGQPDIVVRHPDGSLSAFSAVCTHAVVSGPPPSALASRRVVEAGGSIYAVPS
jgi:hypothetical protein